MTTQNNHMILLVYSFIFETEICSILILFLITVSLHDYDCVF